MNILQKQLKLMKNRSFYLLFILVIFALVNGCKEPEKTHFTGQAGEVKLITLAPGHFHAYLVQKDMYDQVDSTVHVYAPPGSEVEQHVSMIENYNNRDYNPTFWDLVVYTGEDYLERMLEEKNGNVVVLAGKNHNKSNYIKSSVEKGLNVLSDKPMAIDLKDFDLLKKSFESAERNNVLLYDIMTLRYEITSLLQKEIMSLPLLFGTLEKGRPGNPSFITESKHYFFKYVSGNILRRPPWFFDPGQRGEGLVDVATHYVDFIQWSCFPDKIIDYTTDIDMISASRWSTPLTKRQFESITGEAGFPDYLNEYIDNDTLLQVYANGEMNYSLNDVHARVTVKWGFTAPKGAGDTFYSLTRGSNANLIIRQGEEENYKRVLYIQPSSSPSINNFEETLLREFKKVQEKYPGVELKELDGLWKVFVPEDYYIGHEAHFGKVTDKYLHFLIEGKLPDWEVPNMIAKYYTTTMALELAMETK